MDCNFTFTIIYKSILSFTGTRYTEQFHSFIPVWIWHSLKSALCNVIRATRSLQLKFSACCSSVDFELLRTQEAFKETSTEGKDLVNHTVRPLWTIGRQFLVMIFSPVHFFRDVLNASALKIDKCKCCIMIVIWYYILLRFS